jgi:hypothetical protein
MRPTIIDAAKRRYIDGHAHKSICKHRHLSLMDRQQTPFFSLARLVTMARTHRQTGSVCCVATPPPPICKYACINERRKSGARAAGKRWWKAFTPYGFQELLHIHENAHSSLITPGDDSKTDGRQVVKTPFQRIFVAYSSYRNRIILSKQLLFLKLNVYQRDVASCQAPIGLTDVQTYLHPVSMQRRVDDREVEYRLLLLETPGEPILGGNQKKGRGQPEPEKQKPEKPGTENPERGGTKKIQRVKRPKKRIGISHPAKEQRLSGLVIVLRCLC